MSKFITKIMGKASDENSIWSQVGRKGFSEKSCEQNLEGSGRFGLAEDRLWPKIQGEEWILENET